MIALRSHVPAWRGAIRGGVMALFALLWAGGAAMGQTLPAGEAGALNEMCSFYLDFEDSVEARFADGAITPTAVSIERDGATRYVSVKAPEMANAFVAGVQGKALSTRDGLTTLSLTYPAAKNLNSRQGTIVFWMKYDAVVDGPAGNLCFNAPGMMYISMRRQCEAGRTSENTAIWFATPPGAQTQHNGWMVLQRPRCWQPGQWHAVALTWGLEEIRYYEDGVLLGKQVYESGRPMPENMASQFAVVLAGWGGARHDTVVMDELRIFPAALSETLVKALGQTAPTAGP